MTLLAASMSTVPATATEGAAGIRDGINITVFHNIDFVATFGWNVGPVSLLTDEVTVEVERNGVLLGTATGPVVETPEGGALEVNHGPEGNPAPGDCFEAHTPDIRPGDTVRVIGDNTTSEVIVDDITFSGDAMEAPNGDILVKGVAKRANGSNIPVDFLDSAEFRDTSKFRGAPNSVEVDPSVDGGFIMRYTRPYNLVGGRNTNNWSEAQRKESLLTSGGHAIGFGHVDPLPPEAMLVDGLDDVPGPAPGCEDSVAAVNKVQSFSDAVLNAADMAAGGNLMVAGDSFQATRVTVSVGSSTPVAASITPGADGQQTWTASVPKSALSALPDGQMDVTMSADVPGGTIAGVAETLVKDTMAPAAPTASPDGGSISRSTSISLTAAAGDTILYTVGDGSQADPSPSAGVLYTGSFPLAESATLKAIAVDPAGNVSPVMARSFTLATPPRSGGGALAGATGGAASAGKVPLAPSIERVRSGKAGGIRTATVRWRAPKANGAAVRSYKIRAVRVRHHGRSAKIRTAVRVDRDVRRLRLALPRGKYRFRVRAVGAAGDGPWSPSSRKVAAR